MLAVAVGQGTASWYEGLARGAIMLHELTPLRNFCDILPIPLFG